MRKILFASTALAAFGLVGAAQAADPISLKLGGYSTWVAGYADQDEQAPGVDFQDFDVKGTNEVFFLGSTTLDNGLKIGVTMELEAGGQTDTTTDTIDEAYITVDGGFGRIILGSENNGAYLLHNSAPVAAGQFYGEGEVGERRWIVQPAAMTIGGGLSTVQLTTAINTDNDAEKITYVAPSFGGFTVGGSYVPSASFATNAGDNPVQTNEDLSDVIGFAAAYNNTYSGVGVKLSAGWVKVLDTNDFAGIDDHSEWSVGGQFSYAGFTVGGSGRFINQEDNAGRAMLMDGTTWDAGLMYATGPVAVSFTYQNSEGEGAIGGDQDQKEVFMVTGKYNMGPGVDLIAGIGQTDYDGETNLAADSNDGWWAATGIALAF